MKADNLTVEWYKGPEGEGLLIPTDGSFNPMVRARTLATRAMDLGARLYSNSTAVKIDGRQVVTDKNCLISCKRVIVAVDGKLEVILPELKSKVRTTRLQMLATAPAHDVKFTHCNYMRDGYDYWQ